jgi:cation diffusion facilitator CzcD-associated flavoprotein CzcO
VSSTERRFDVVIVGAGFAGLYMLHRVRELGLSAIVLEAEEGIGGTWYRNRYPGARVDIESFDYSYSFSPELDQEWEWTERYASQPNVLAYIDHVADRFDLRRDIQLGTRVSETRWSEEERRWSLTTEAGESFSCRFCITAVGGLSQPKVPDIEGIADFAGPVYRSTDWPRDAVDLEGLRVGVIGTGSTGIQMIPELARRAGHVTVFQRTPNFSLPNRNRPLTDEDRSRVKAEYVERRRRTRESDLGLPVPIGEQTAQEVDDETRRREFDQRWAAGGGAFLLAYSDLLVDPDSNEIAADYFRERIREKVEDPETAAKLMPSGYPVGAKRLCLDTDYFETFNRDNVSLVDLGEEPLGRVTEAGVRTAAGEYEIDVLVLALGFDAVTGSILALDIHGRDGSVLADVWAEGPRAHLGLQVAGFPNLFLLTGPGSPSIIVNVVAAIEQHVEWVAGCLRYLDEHAVETIEADRDAQDAWVEHVREVAEATLFPRADSFYVGANVPGKPRVFMPYLGGIANYAAVCERVAANGYEGFELVATAQEAAA